LFSVPLSAVSKRRERDAFLAFSNWHREQNDVLVMRLNPERTVLLFGPHTNAISVAVANWEAGATRKFKLVGNMVAPVCAYEVARLVDAQAGDGGVHLEDLRTVRGAPSMHAERRHRSVGDLLA
jgi:hypothetical protein